MPLSTRTRFATLRASYRPQNAGIPKKRKFPHPGLGLKTTNKNTEEIRKRHKNDRFRMFSAYFFLSSRPGPEWDFFPYFRDSEVFVVCTRAAGSQHWIKVNLALLAELARPGPSGASQAATAAEFTAFQQPVHNIEVPLC